MDEYYLYTFESTHGAIASHKMLKAEMDAVMMPVLREISASCGMAVRIAPKNRDRSIELMKQNSEVQFDLYHVNGKEVEKLDLSKN